MKTVTLNLISICCALAQGTDVFLAAANVAAGRGEQLGYFALFQRSRFPGMVRVSLCLGLDLDCFTVGLQPLVSVH